MSMKDIIIFYYKKNAIIKLHAYETTNFITKLKLLQILIFFDIILLQNYKFYFYKTIISIKKINNLDYE